MKKVLAFIAFALITLSVFSQTPEIILFRCTESVVHNIKTGESLTYETNFIIKSNIDEGKISFDNEMESIYYIRYMTVEDKQQTDDEGDTYRITSFKAYDEEGIDCIFSVIIYDEFPLSMFSAAYSDIVVIWKVNSLQ